jgi:5'-3' exonuclease
MPATLLSDDIVALPATTETLIVYDTSVIAHKLYNIVNPPKGEKGTRKQLDAIATAGIDFYNRLSWLPNLTEPAKIIWVKDSKPYWRKEIFPAYKSKRAPQPDKDWFIKRFVSEVNPIGFDGYEADDVAAAIVKLNPDKRIILGTIDSDWIQMVDERVIWCCLTGFLPQYRDIADGLAWFRAKLLEESKKRQRILLEEYGVDGSDLRQIVDWKVVCGDKSDNLPPGSDRCLIDLFNPPKEYDLKLQLDIKQIIESRYIDRQPRSMERSFNFFERFDALPTSVYCDRVQNLPSASLSS